MQVKAKALVIDAEQWFPGTKIDNVVEMKATAYVKRTYSIDSKSVRELDKYSPNTSTEFEAVEKDQAVGVIHYEFFSNGEKSLQRDFKSYTNIAILRPGDWIVTYSSGYQTAMTDEQFITEYEAVTDALQE